MLRALTITALATLALAHRAAAQQQHAAPAPHPTAPQLQLTNQSRYRVLPHTGECSFAYQTVSTKYSVVGFSHFDGDPPHLVLEEKTTIEQCENMEGPNRAEVSVIARPARNPLAAPVWTLRRGGDVGAVDDRYGTRPMYRVTVYGCCGAQNLDIYHSLTNGRRLFAADHPLLHVESDNVGYGLIAVHDAQAADELPNGEHDTTAIALITFAPVDATQQRLLLRGPSNDFFLNTVELVARGPGGAVKHAQELTSSDRLDARWTVAVAIEVEGMTEGTASGRVEIPIERGRLALEKARAPAPFRVVAAPPRQ